MKSVSRAARFTLALTLLAASAAPAQNAPAPPDAPPAPATQPNPPQASPIEPAESSSAPQATAEAAAQPQDKRFSITVRPADAGRFTLALSNQGRLAILAWAVEVVDPGSSSAQSTPVHLFFDTAANYPQDQPLQPGAEIARPLPGRIGASATPANVAVKAVIFSDGSTAGDPAWIDKMLARRRRMYIAINKVEEIIRGDVAKEARTDQLVSDISRERLVARRETEDADVNAAADRVYSIATGLFNSTRKVNEATQAIWNIYEPWRDALRNSVPIQAMD